MTKKKEKFNLLPKQKKSVWLRVGTLIDGISLQPFYNAHIVYNAESILFVGGENNSPPPHIVANGQTEPDLNLPDFTLLPGLIEAHAHLFLEGSEIDAERRKAQFKISPQVMLRQAQARLEKLLQFGIIAVRDAGDKFGVGLSLSKLYSNRGDISLRDVICPVPQLPYIDSPGAAINHKGGYGGFIAGPVENYQSLHDCVKSRIDAGAERIKIIATDVIDFRTGEVTKAPQMTVEEISELVKAAKQFGKQTFAHASGDDGIEKTIEGGVDSIEHGFFVREDQLAKMRDRNIAWCPTFAPIQKQIDYADRLGWNDNAVSNLKRILDRHSNSIAKAQHIGITVIAGSDAGSYGVAHGLGLIDELELMERAGLSPIAVINSATGNSSSRLAFKEQFGQIKPGYKSRFILAKYSPLKSISNLRKEKYIMFDGIVHEGNENIPHSGL